MTRGRPAILAEGLAKSYGETRALEGPAPTAGYDRGVPQGIFFVQKFYPEAEEASLEVEARGQWYCSLRAPTYRIGTSSGPQRGEAAGAAADGGRIFCRTARAVGRAEAGRTRALSGFEAPRLAPRGGRVVVGARRRERGPGREARPRVRVPEGHGGRALGSAQSPPGGEEAEGRLRRGYEGGASLLLDRPEGPQRPLRRRRRHLQVPAEVRQGRPEHRPLGRRRTNGRAVP